MKQQTRSMFITLPEQVTDIAPEYRQVPADVAMHCHDCYEIEVVVSGSGTQVLNGQSCQLRNGSVTLLAPSDFHAVTPHKDLFVYNFMFRGSMLSEKALNVLWAYGGNKFLHFQGEELKEIMFIPMMEE